MATPSSVIDADSMSAARCVKAAVFSRQSRSLALASGAGKAIARRRSIISSRCVCGTLRAFCFYAIAYVIVMMLNAHHGVVLWRKKGIQCERGADVCKAVDCTFPVTPCCSNVVRLPCKLNLAPSAFTISCYHIACMNSFMCNIFRLEYFAKSLPCVAARTKSRSLFWGV